MGRYETGGSYCQKHYVITILYTRHNINSTSTLMCIYLYVHSHCVDKGHGGTRSAYHDWTLKRFELNQISDREIEVPADHHHSSERADVAE